MRILHIIAPVYFGGGESLLCNLLAQRRQGFEEAVALLYSSKALENRLNRLDVEVLRLSRSDIGHGMSKWQAVMSTGGNLLKAGRVRNYVKKRGVDIVHAHGYPACLVAGVASRGRIAKRVYTHHGLRRKPPGWLERRFLEGIYRRFHALTGVSSAVCQSMERAFKADLHFRSVYNCISADFFELHEMRRPEEVLPRTEKKRFVQVGRFTKPKNQMLVARGMARLDREFLQQIEVVFAGDGPNLEEVKRFVVDRGISGSFRFLGHLAYEKVPRLLAECHYGLLPGRDEGFSISTAECLAAGHPILAVDTPTAREIIGEHGVFVPEDRYHAGFREILRRDFERESIKKWARRFSPDSVKEAYIRIYREVAG